jgi:hypothetical protein
MTKDAAWPEIGSYRAELAKLTGGPRYVSVRIAAGNLPRALPARDGVFLKHRLRARLGFPVMADAFCDLAGIEKPRLATTEAQAPAPKV